MRAGSRFAKRNGRAAAAVLVSVLLASCTTDPNLEIGMPGYNATAASADASSGDLESAGVDVAPQPVMNAEGDTPLPTQVASVPALKPAGETAVTATAEAGATPAALPAAVAETAKPAQAEVTAAADAATEAKPAEVATASGAETAAENATAGAKPVAQPIAPKKKGFLSALFSPAPAAKPAAAAEAAKPAPAESADAEATPATASAVPTPKPVQAADEAKPAEAAAPAAEHVKPAAENAVYVTAGEMPAAQPIAPKKKGFLSAFFGASPASAAPSPIKQREEPKPIVETEPKETKPIITLASAKPAEKPVRMASLGDDNALPGVRQTALFEIKRKSGIDDDSDVDLHEDEDGGPVLASAAGLARLAPNGLLKQTDRVDVACLKPSLVRVLKTVERHYGKNMIITSGYRSPAHNRRARGAKNSLHMYCAAVDVQIPGVSKWELAKFARSMPGRGGVGTYCHTESVHIDVGPERDWNWRCRRRKG
ncbi:YcbK family protein [Allomesorhizobium camelthorni]|uniref:YcbK family protein n=1 Tax=Allomesorhizobium camelthorni TaxID=475069 RepID=A0A6G4WAR1_9HYPH|nr:YcbK family protein [Mesorhizobium camelthorni]NGO51326.1 YcbK family protein [Mesorhizobium camelthorni]